MIDYSQMSDIEIDTAVSKLCSPEFHRNYCNNPADALLIITANKISLMWMAVENEWCATALGELEEGCWEWSYCPDHYINDANPLRAAMIVFLMVRDAENAPAI